MRRVTRLDLQKLFHPENSSKCYGHDHISYNCPNKRMFSFTDQGLIEEVYIEILWDNNPKDEYQLLTNAMKFSTFNEY